MASSDASQLAAHGGNDLRTLQLTSHDEVVEKDIQGVGFTCHAYSKLAEVFGIRAKRAERELSVLNEARLQYSNWAHHASMSQHVSMELASICSERGSTKAGSVGYDVQGATVAPFTATATTVAPSPEISKASAGGLFQNWPNYDPQAYYAQVFQNSFPVTEIGNDAKENSVVDTGPAISLSTANLTATRGATSTFAAHNLEWPCRNLP